MAKNADFIALAQHLVEQVDASRPADVEALLASTLADGQTVADPVQEQSAKIGEKLVRQPLRRAGRHGRRLPAPQEPRPAARRSA